MNINISIDGVLRNTIQKFEYHYHMYYNESDVEENKNFEIDSDGEVIENENQKNNFDYKIIHPIKNDDLKNYFTFQSDDEYNHFSYVEFPVEIYGHAGLSYPGVITDLNNLIYKNKKHTFTLIGVNEFVKAKPSTLFFLSKNGFLGDNIHFIKHEDIKKQWKKCDIWITDNQNIIKLCPFYKKSIKFNTQYNDYFKSKYEINKLTEITKLCNFLEENTI
jgi:hypothetical protein